MANSTAKLIMEFLCTQIVAEIDLVDACYWDSTKITNEDVKIWIESEISEVFSNDPNTQGVNTEIDEKWLLTFAAHGKDHDEECQVVEALQLMWQKQGNAIMIALQALKPNGNQVINMTSGIKQYPAKTTGTMGNLAIMQFEIEVRLFFPT